MELSNVLAHGGIQKPSLKHYLPHSNHEDRIKLKVETGQRMATQFDGQTSLLDYII